MPIPSQLVLPHSGLGVISLVLFLVALVSFALILMIKSIGKLMMLPQLVAAVIIIVLMWILTAGFLHLKLGDMNLKEIRLVKPWMLIMPWLFLLIALGLSIAALISPC